jgi:hypothetical protein
MEDQRRGPQGTPGGTAPAGDVQRALDAASGEPRDLSADEREERAERAERGWEGSREQREANDAVDRER